MSKWTTVLVACLLLPFMPRLQDEQFLQGEKGLAEAVQPGPGKGKGGDVVHQGFPAKGAPADHKTSWEVHWDFVPSINKGAQILRIVSAEFKFKDKNKQWKSVMVARDIHLVEALSYYDDGHICFLDLSHTPRPNDSRADLTVQPKPQLEQCILPGETLDYSKDANLKILREVHDDGIRWMSGYASKPGQNQGYRGEKLVLIGSFQAVNYVYLMQYDFTDDGRIVCRLGFTAHDLRARYVMANDGDAHLHVGCWRMDFDLSDVTQPQSPVGGPKNNDYRIINHRYNPATKRFQQNNDAFGGGNEGKEKWLAEDFTALRVQSDIVKNAHKQPLAYDLIPSRYGSVRGLLPILDVKGEDMDFINYDFWVTHRPASPLQPYQKLPDLAAKQRPLKGNAATVWYNSGALHAPRGEDFSISDGISNRNGLALTTWIEFTLRPREMFDGTPLYK